MSHGADRQNVGSIEAFIRVSGGLFLLALAGFGRFNRIASWTMFAAGAASVATGVVRYCPLVAAVRGSSHEVGEAVFGEEEEEEPPVPRDAPWERVAGRLADEGGSRREYAQGREDRERPGGSRPNATYTRRL